MSKARYMNPFTDFGFKKLLGEESSLPLLRALLNTLLPEAHQIESLEFRQQEFMGRSQSDRRAVFDLFCVSEKGERFIVELQKQKQDYFKDRMLYYATFPIQEQAEKGDWNFKLKPVYCVGILDFCFDDEEEQEEVVRHIKLKDQNDKVFNDKLTFVTVEMPRFTKKEAELTGELDQMLYFFKHLGDFDDIPEIFMGKKLFEEAFTQASIPLLSEQDNRHYEQSLKVYRDLTNVVDSAKNEGFQEGEVIGMEKGLEIGLEKGLDIALQKLLSSGMDEKQARQILGLPS